MGLYDRGDPDIGVTRSQLALGVRRERPHAYRVADLGGPFVLAILWLVLPFEASDTARWAGAAIICATGPLDQIGRQKLPPAWSNIFLLATRAVVGSCIALAVPFMWYSAAVVLMCMTAGATTVESPKRVAGLATISLVSLTIVGAIHEVAYWHLVVGAFALSIGAHLAWFREWNDERAEVDRRHEEMVDRARMFSWEINSSTGEIVSMAGNTEAVLGWKPEELVGKHVDTIVGAATVQEAMRKGGGERRFGSEVHSVVVAKHRDGSEVVLREVRLHSPRKSIVRGVSVDMTELARATEALRYQAEHDALTGLSNRIVVEEVINAALRENPDQPITLIHADLDRFKEVNDTLGHPAGDRLLRVLASRLTKGLSHLDAVARMGGDEFAFVAIGVHGADAACKLGEEIHRLATDPIEVDGLQLAVACSVGVAWTPDHGSSYEDLLKRADIATYQAKREGGGVVAFESTPDDLSIRRLQLISEVGGALDRGEFELHFQPQVDLATGAIVGVEGLARWRHPEFGLLSPGGFFHAIEVAADYQRFSNEMLRQAADFAAQIAASGHRLHVAVNLGSMSFLDQRLPKTVASLLHDRNLDGCALTLEVIESDLLDEQRGAEVFRELEQLGVRLSIDDFGTGYSTFSRLRALDVAEVKIDRAFVQGLGMSAEDAIIVRSTVQLAQLLGLDVVAEGVETKHQLEWLQRMGCGVAQGFLWSPAVHRDDMIALILAGTTYDVGFDGTHHLEGERLDIEVRGALLDQMDNLPIRAALVGLLERLDATATGRGIVVRDLAGRLLVANETFKALLPPGTYTGLVGSHDDGLLAGRGPGAVSIASTGLSGVDGFHTTVLPLRDRNGRTVGAVHMVTEVESAPA
jgi:diguanylate cyclase (GGDEF)-like protein/PAS domain S-box-containing protein